MHSSRMRTGRSLTVCCSLLPGGVSAFRGDAWSGGEGEVMVLSAWGEVPSPWGGGGVCSGGVSAQGCLVWAGVLPAQRPPCEQNHTHV